MRIGWLNRRRCASEPVDVSSDVWQIDWAWQRRREVFLDAGHEPRAPDLASVLAVGLCFLFLWGMMFSVDAGGLTVAGPAACCVVALSSLRWTQFKAAFECYMRRRTIAERRLRETPGALQPL